MNSFALLLGAESSQARLCRSKSHRTEQNLRNFPQRLHTVEGRSHISFANLPSQRHNSNKKQGHNNSDSFTSFGSREERDRSWKHPINIYFLSLIKKKRQTLECLLFEALFEGQEASRKGEHQFLNPSSKSYSLPYPGEFQS